MHDYDVPKTSCCVQQDFYEKKKASYVVTYPDSLSLGKTYSKPFQTHTSLMHFLRCLYLNPVCPIMELYLFHCNAISFHIIELIFHNVASLFCIMSQYMLFVHGQKLCCFVFCTMTLYFSCCNVLSYSIVAISLLHLSHCTWHFITILCPLHHN